jgi:hypothetical protein
MVYEGRRIFEGESSMPPFVIPPLVKFALGALGAGAVVTWTIKEMRRVNAELDRIKVGPPPDRRELPTLRRDPRTGDWRL